VLAEDITIKIVKSPTKTLNSCLTLNLIRILFFLPQLLKEINRTSRGLRFQRQAEPRAYVAAYFKELPGEFKLGDAKVYGDFENKQLQNGQEYIFFVLAILEMSENVRVM